MVDMDEACALCGGAGILFNLDANEVVPCFECEGSGYTRDEEELPDEVSDDDEWEVGIGW